VECTSWQSMEEKPIQLELSSLATILAMLGCNDGPRSEPLGKAPDTLFCRCRDDHMESIGGTHVYLAITRKEHALQESRVFKCVACLRHSEHESGKVPHAVPLFFS